MSTRRRAREVVIQLLFQRDLNPKVDMDREALFIRSRLRGDQSTIRFAQELLQGIEKEQARIDELLGATSENWDLNRMAATDRSILRVAAYEIAFADTPGKVAINEAIELAKRYGTNNSAHFVNGVLDRLLNGESRKQQPES